MLEYKKQSVLDSAFGFPCSSCSLQLLNFENSLRSDTQNSAAAASHFAGKSAKADSNKTLPVFLVFNRRDNPDKRSVNPMKQSQVFFISQAAGT